MIENETAQPERLAQFRAEWPAVSGSDVRAEDPRAYRSASTGAFLLLPAVVLSLVTIVYFLDLPFALPSWLDSVWGLVTVTVSFGAIGVWIIALALLSKPSNARSGCNRRSAPTPAVRSVDLGVRLLCLRGAAHLSVCAWADPRLVIGSGRPRM
ncbi:hypothetical protein [Leucobacter denitrificans]|uniref:Uncharacterized protein n=1 Tax=Leucobacter denitrificans TaxID=683042 RepID=A0A7G9S2T0_9MICO|nr:hypothetical protein [Leucobacter denitrificans]QNN62155.1 hypothetical protein H9L06_07590 [Leucobacter denitrificans]